MNSFKALSLNKDKWFENSFMSSFDFFQNYLDEKTILMLSLFTSFRVFIPRVVTKL